MSKVTFTLSMNLTEIARTDTSGLDIWATAAEIAKTLLEAHGQDLAVTGKSIVWNGKKVGYTKLTYRGE